MLEVTEVIMPDKTTPGLQTLKSSVYEGIQAVKDNLRVQSWLNPPQSHLRENTLARNFGARIGQGGGIRTMSISDIGDAFECGRLLACSYAGVGVRKLISDDQTVYAGKSGTLFHDAVERVLPSSFVTSWSEEHRLQTGPKPVNRTKVWWPGVGVRTSADYGSRSGLGGRIDGYIEPSDSGFELKSLSPKDMAEKGLPASVSGRYLGQAAGYQAAILRRSPKRTDGAGYWSPQFWTWVFLPQDLHTLIPEDPSTYRVFIATRQQLLEAEKQVRLTLKEIAGLVDQWGIVDAVREIPPCTRPDCNFCKNTQPFLGVTQRFQ